MPTLDRSECERLNLCHLPPEIIELIESLRPKMLLARMSDRTRGGKDLKGALDAAARPYRSVPAVARILTIPFEVVENSAEGARLRKLHGVREVVVPGRRRVVGFVVTDADWSVWIVPDSARSEAEDGSNDFVNALISFIDEYKPIMVGVAEFERLVRSFVHSGPTFGALRRNGTFVVEAGWEVLDPTAADAVNRFAVKSAKSDEDGEKTVERLLHGQLQEAEEGRWPWAEVYLPPGYRFVRGSDGFVAAGEVSRDAASDLLVAEFVRLGATSMTDGEIADLVGPLGMIAPRKTLEVRKARRNLDVVTVDQLIHKDFAVRNQYERSLEIYRTGLLPVEMVNKLKHRKHIRGLIPDSDGVFRFTIDLGGPHPAVTESQIQAAMKVRLDRKAKRVIPTGAAIHAGPRKPFSGLGHSTDDENMWSLGAQRREGYHVYRRPLTESYDPLGYQLGFRGHGSAIAYMRSVELHRSFADALMNLDADVNLLGVPVVVRNTSSDSKARQVAVIEERISDLGRQIAGALAMAEMQAASGDLESARLYETSRREHADNLAESEAELAQLRATQTPVTDPTEANFGSLAAVVAALRRYPIQAPPELNEALRSLVTELRFDVDEMKVAWTSMLRVSGDAGEALQLELCGSVPNRQKLTRDGKPSQVQRRKRNLERYLKDGLTVEAIAEESGFGDIDAVKRGIGVQLMDHLPSRGMRSALMDCPIPEVRRIIWSAISGTPVPKGIDPDYAKHVVKVYTGNETWTRAWAADTHVFRRSVLAAVRAHNDPAGMPIDMLCEALDTSLQGIRSVLDPYRVGSQNRARPYGPALARTQPWGKQCTLPRDEMRVEAVNCIHCDSSDTHILRVPEVPGDLLCNECRRPANAPHKFKFPATYLQQWQGPRGAGTGRHLIQSGTMLAPSDEG